MVAHMVHNHGPAEGAGLDCPEQVDHRGRLVGRCLAPVPMTWTALAWVEPQHVQTYLDDGWRIRGDDAG